QIRPAERASRIYDAVFPTAVDGALATGAAVALDAEVGWLEDHRERDPSGARKRATASALRPVCQARGRRSRAAGGLLCGPLRGRGSTKTLAMVSSGCSRVRQ